MSNLLTPTTYYYEAYHDSGTLAADTISTIQLSGVERIRLQASGTGLLYTFWNGTTNAELAEVEAVTTVPDYNSRVLKVTIAGGADGFYPSMNIEIRASDGTTVKARGIVKSAARAGNPWRQPAPTGESTVLSVVIADAPGSALAAGDLIFGLDPSRTNLLGNYVAATAEANGGVIVDVPGPVQKGGVLAFTRAASSTLTVFVHSLVAPRNA